MAHFYVEELNSSGAPFPTYARVRTATPSFGFWTAQTMKGGADILSASRVQVSKRRKPISSSSLVTVVPVGTVMERNYRTSSLGPWGLGGTVSFVLQR